MDLLDLYGRASEWTLDRVGDGSGQLDASTPCEGWTVRELLDHMLETGRYFAGRARGEDLPPPGPVPPRTLDDDPVGAFARLRTATLDAYSEDGVLDRTGPLLGIAFTEQLLHGWDLAVGTDQDATLDPEVVAVLLPDILEQEEMLRGSGMFGERVPVADDADDGTRLLAVLGREAG